MPSTIHQLSILIPTYNDLCVGLVDALSAQACKIRDFEYEILVADDGSNMLEIVEQNRKISSYPRCQYIIRDHNVGRSAIRNFLAQKSRYDHLLFIDSHMSIINERFLSNYLDYFQHPLVYGGYTINTNADKDKKDNLRFAYEVSCINMQDPVSRMASPYANFHTSNFMIRRKVLLAHPLDERFRRYGYEDVLFGKQLKAAGIPILHIDNPVGFERFESNQRFLEKTEEGLHTLYEFKTELSGYSRLLSLSERLRSCHLSGILSLIHNSFGKLMKRNLTGRHPSLFLFKIYRLTYLTSLIRKDDLI